MPGIFRFSNAVSDIDKIIDTYKKIYSHFIQSSEEGKYFDHAEAAKFLAMNGLASSLGAIGATALSRSTREDKSRDPLYNQHKSYSEMFRMLGWYEPGSMQTNFMLTEYGSYIADNEKEVVKKLLCMNVLHIVSPNPLTNVKGGNILRPFPLMLKLMLKLDGVITRDEIIVGVLCCQDDTLPNIVDHIASEIKNYRNKGTRAIDEAILKIRKQNNLGSSATLQNYTRFPIAIMKWSGWAEGVNKRGLYGNKTIKTLSITEEGRKVANQLSTMPDIRFGNIQKYLPEEQGAFVALSNLLKLRDAGFNIGEYASALPELQKKCARIMSDFKLTDNNFLFFGYQEAPRKLLVLADRVLDSL